MNKYVVPICDIENEQIFNLVISARSLESCKEKIMQRYSDISDADTWPDFTQSLDRHDILIGKISDIETL